MNHPRVASAGVNEAKEKFCEAKEKKDREKEREGRKEEKKEGKKEGAEESEEESSRRTVARVRALCKSGDRHRRVLICGG